MTDNKYTPTIGDICRIEEWIAGEGWTELLYEYRIDFIGKSHVVATTVDTVREVERVFTECKFHPRKTESEKLLEEVKEVVEKMDTGTDILSKLIDLGYIKKSMSYEDAYNKARDAILANTNTQCNECDGTGFVLSHISQGPDGPIERNEDCELCGGSGYAITDVDEVVKSLGFVPPNAGRSRDVI